MTVAWGLIVLAAAWIGWAYAGYPLALWILRWHRPRPVRRGDVSPSVSIVIAVHDGGRELRRKLVDTLALEYSGARELIVSSDGSTDETEAIAREFEREGVVLVTSSERRGKEAAQAAAIACAGGDVVVFTDVGAKLDPGALRAIVRPFADPSVGCVSSVDVVESRGGEALYVRYEMAIRALESEVATLIGCSGSCFAVRRELCDPWPAELASDFRSALEAARRGFRAVDEPLATVRFGTARSDAEEWARKVRTVRRGLAVLAAYRSLLHPRHGRTAFALWSHKVARFTSPFALVALLLATAVTAPASSLAAALLVAQIGFYGVGGLALRSRSLAKWFPARGAAFFILVNASMLVAWGHHLRGERAVVWSPTRR